MRRRSGGLRRPIRGLRSSFRGSRCTARVLLWPFPPVPCPRVLMAAIVFLFAAAAGTAQTRTAQTVTPLNRAVTVKTVHYLPQEFYVGDLAEIRIQIEPMPGVSLVSPAEMPESSWISFKSVTVDTDKEFPEIRIRLVSFQPGIRALPPIDLGGAVLQDLKIHTTSVLRDDTVEFAEPFGPVILPGSRLLLVIGAIVLLAGPLLILMFWERMGTALKENIRAGRRKLPYRRFLKGMAQIAGQEEALSADEYYTKLSDTVRSYLTLRLGKNLISATSRESEGILRCQFGDFDGSRSIAEFLSGADRVRFGGETASLERKREDLSLCRAQVEAVEELMKRREKGKENVDL